MAQYSNNASGLNISIDNKTVSSTVDINGLNIKGVNNITLLDSSDAIVKKGSEIDSSLSKNDSYNIYGAPAKWILDKEQQYNNCGIESCLNILAIAGKYDIKDQNKDENEFTLWAITNKYTSPTTGEEDTYGVDTIPFGKLNLEDGATVYEQRKELLKAKGLESGSIGDYAEEGNAWYAESKYFTEANGGDGNDTYNIGLGATKITDTSGDNDVVNINAGRDSVGIFFNVAQQNNIFDNTNTSDLFLFDSTKLDEILAEFGETEQLPTDKLVQIENYFGKGQIEKVNTNDSSYFTIDQINTIKENVTTWLNTKDYVSTEDVLQSGNTQDINELLQLYGVTWQQ